MMIVVTQARQCTHFSQSVPPFDIQTKVYYKKCHDRHCGDHTGRENVVIVFPKDNPGGLAEEKHKNDYTCVD